MDGDDPGVAADVAELVVVGSGEDLAAEAAHEADTWRRLVEVVGARGRRHRVGVELGGVEWV